ncbi:MAG TPA: prolipoprotein diacylglyceryl transferase [Candidatus Acidoferrum sp.]|nr:prolipoprotein diacylglyceryl transferase [Candidatus Acidoferrum sp.]
MHIVRWIARRLQIRIALLYGARRMHPIAFYLGNWPVHWYGVLVAIGFLAGLWTASRRGLLHGLRPEQVGDAGPWIIIGAIIGARTLYVVTYWKEKFAGGPWKEIFMVQHGGLVFYGGFIGAALAILLYCRFRKVHLWKLTDALAPSVALGYVFGRLGCLMNGCCFGRSCSAPWAIKFPPHHETAGALVHPTQIYDSLLSLATYLFLAWLYRRKKFDGQIFALYLVCYAFTRSFVEYFRGDYGPAHIHAGFFTPAQLISVGILLVGLVLAFTLKRFGAVKFQPPRSKP